MYPLSRTSAMGCLSWGVPAGPAKAGGTCALGYNARGTCKSCYAMQNRYRQVNVQDAQARRFREWREKGAAWLAPIIAKNCKPGSYFRVFDSGDFSDINDMWEWHEVCRMNPDVNFWIVTRSWRAASRIDRGERRDGIHYHLTRLQRLPNVNVRLSYDLGEEEHVQRVANMTGCTMVVVGHGAEFACPKQRFPDGKPRHAKDASCEAAGCRRCWSKDAKLQTFEIHGKEVDLKAIIQKREVMAI